MLISSYNNTDLDDVLLIIVNPDANHQVETKHGDIVKIADEKGIATGFNFFHASKVLPTLKGKNGQVHLTQTDLDTLNQALHDQNFADVIKLDDQPRFVVGYVNSVKEHPKSDHLKITQTTIDNNQTLQIVSGSPNMRENIKVVVAKVGAMMPNGMIIWPGELKGIESDGMICSGRELHLPNAPQKPGALILPDDYQVGTAFDFHSANNLFN